MLSIIVRTISKMMYLFMILYGFYIIVHGHLTPGGAFPGGVLMVSPIVLLTLAYGIKKIKQERREIELAEVLETDALIAILGVFLFTVLIAKVMPRELLLTGSPGTLASGGPIPLLNFGGGLEVTAALAIIFLSMVFMKKGWRHEH